MRLALVLVLLTLAAAIASGTPYQAVVHYPDLPSNAWPRVLATDTTGNLFIVSYLGIRAGRSEVHILKTDAQGKTLASMSFGFNSDTAGGWGDEIADAATDEKGNLVILATTSSTDFPLISPSISNTAVFTALVIKVDSQLKNILYSTRLGGQRGQTFAGALALDKAGNIYVTGGTTASDFPVTSGAFQRQPPQSNGSSTARYAYLTEIGADLRTIVFSTYYGDSTTSCTGSSSTCANTFGVTYASAIALDATGNVVIAGGTTATKLPTTSGVIGSSCGACASYPQSSAGFVAKFSADGSKLRWASYVPVAPVPYTGRTDVTTIALDATDNVIIGGQTSRGLAVTAGTVQTVFPGPAVGFGGFAGYVMKLDPGAQRTLFSTYFGLEDPYRAFGLAGLAVGPKGTIWITGVSMSDGLPVPKGTAILGEDYLVELSADGSTLTNIFTAPQGTTGLRVALSAAGSATVLGTSGTLLMATIGQGPSLVGIGNAAGSSTSTVVAPYELVSFYGAGLGPQTAVEAHAVDGVLPSSLGGTQVLFNGTPAPMLFAGPTQINAIVPAGVFASDSTTLRIVTPSGSLDGPTMGIRPSQPGVFTGFSTNSGLPVPAAVALNQDGSVNSTNNPAALGSIVTVWASGGGMSSAPQPDGTILGSAGGRPTLPVSIFSTPVLVAVPFGGSSPGPWSLEVLYAGDASGMVAGVSQINFRLPAQVDSSLNNVGFVLQIGGAFSDMFGIYLKPRQ